MRLDCSDYTNNEEQDYGCFEQESGTFSIFYDSRFTFPNFNFTKRKKIAFIEFIQSLPAFVRKFLFFTCSRKILPLAYSRNF